MPAKEGRKTFLYKFYNQQPHNHKTTMQGKPITKQDILIKHNDALCSSNAQKIL
jgi:hypothetical protein